MRIICVIPVYNCGDMLLETLRSVDGKVDEIHCYDTCWLINSSTLHSSDDTKQIIENFSKTSKTKADYIMLSSPMSEQKCRDASIENVAEGDWVFAIDSDEVVIRWDDNVRSILENTIEKGFFWYMDNHMFPVCRLFRKEKCMKYFTCRVCDSKGKILQALYMININVRHDFNKRKREKHASETAQRPHP